jgi:diguanylate cyclase (GGDEF)-like protein/PAS domain S-box-containing protein
MGTLDVREDGAIESIDVDAARLFGCQPHDVLGRSITELIPSYQDPVVHDDADPSARHGVHLTWRETHGLRRDGARFPIELVATGLPLREHGFFVAVRDITARTEAAQDAESRFERQKIVLAAQQYIAGAGHNLQEMMRKITQSSQEITAADGAVVELVEGNDLVYAATSGSAERFLGFRIRREGSLSGLCVHENRLLRADDTLTDPRVDAAACIKIGVRSMVVVPLHTEGHPVGVLKVMSGQPHAFDEGHVALLQLMATFLSAEMLTALASEKVRQNLALVQRQNAELEARRQELALANAQLTEANRKLEALATTDGLTGARNHRAMQERLAEMARRTERSGVPYSVVLLDVDRFKQFNDQFGHGEGDRVLKEIVRILQDCARGTDMVARYGGEEFVVLMPDTGVAGAREGAERFRIAIESAVWTLRPVTASFGVATSNGLGRSGTEIVELADRALYSSKAAGRNRVTCAYDPDPVRDRSQA